MHTLLSRFVLIAVLAVMTSSAQADLTIGRVHCEYADNPLGIDVPQPRLGWVLESSDRGVLQSAYQLLAASSEEILQQDKGDLWDTGKVKSDDSIHVVYAGKVLTSGQRVWWKVRAWDQKDRPSAWSKPAWWEMALLQPADWTGKWICSDVPLPTKEEELYGDHPAPMFRKEFTAGKKIARARAYVSGLGYYELYLNGQRVGDHVLDPGWTTYAKRVLYSAYDVTALLREGPNAVGAIVGNGWYNPLPLRFWGHINIREHLTIGRPRLILQLNIEYADGTRAAVVTDESWKVGDSPILRNSIYLGEVYDARKEQAGWNTPGFDESKWRPVALSTEPIGPLQAQFAPPIRITRTLKPIGLTEPKPGVYIYDLGQNFAGWVRLKVAGTAGTTVKLRYGELLNPDGTLNVMTSVCGQIKSKGVGGPGAPDVAYQSETYILKGGGEETYTPRFTFHGFRYVELTGLPAKPPLDAIEGLRLNADVRQVGKFECSDPLFNRIHEIVQWTVLSNLFSVQSDCPHREKFGYGGDIVASSEAIMFNYDMAQFYAKAVRDLADAARPNGGLTETAPFVGIADEGFGEGTGPIEWGTAHPVLLKQLHDYYGNRRLLEEQYDTTKRWVDFLTTQAKDSLIERGISDHESLVTKPVAITGTAFYHHNVVLVARIAELLGHADDAKRYSDLAAQINVAFNKKHWHPDTGIYGQEINQTAQAMALYTALAPAKQFEATLKALRTDVMEKHKGHLTTGIFGTKYVLPALSALGEPDDVYTILAGRDFPGYGHMLERGATTLWEHWEYSDNTYSHNHPMFASVDEWFYSSVAGINPTSKSIGFGTLDIIPHPGGGLTYAQAEYDSIRGLIRSEWKQDGNVFTLRVTIPANSQALVFVPAKEKDRITESGQPADKAIGVALDMRGEDSAIFAVGSGNYEFRVQP